MAVIKKYDLGLLRYMDLFEQITRFRPKDCFVMDNTIFYLTDRGKTRIAIGHQGKNIKEMRKALDKHIKIVEWAENPEGLVRSFLFPIRPSELYISDETGSKIINIKLISTKQRRMLLADKQAELGKLKKLINHYFEDISDIKILQNL